MGKGAVIAELTLKWLRNYCMTQSFVAVISSLSIHYDGFTESIPAMKIWFKTLKFCTTFLLQRIRYTYPTTFDMVAAKLDR